MACRVRYLNSAGIHRREIPGIDALTQAYPPEWLIYASLQCYPPQAPPIEIDVMLVMDDRVLLLEIKDWNGHLTNNGDQWLLNGQPRGRSAVDVVSLKAKQVKSFLASRIDRFSGYFVDSRVVLTGSATKQELPQQEQAKIWTLQEACAIADARRKSSLLGSVQLHAKRVYQFEPDFERLTRNARMFGPLERNWDGYRAVDLDFVTHPRGVWREHRAERVRDPRYRALLRVWAFDQLPPGLNSTDHRRFIAERESRAIGFLQQQGSRLVHTGGVLMPTGEDKEEILTQHFELRSLLPGWTTLDRFLERNRDELSIDDRIDATVTLLNSLTDLHKCGIAHRDLGPRSIWMGRSTRIALSGLMSCHIPDEDSLGDWSSTLRGYSRPAPEDGLSVKSTGMQRDVYYLGCLAYQLLTGVAPEEGQPLNRGGLPPGLEYLIPWLERATAASPDKRFPDAVSMSETLGVLIDETGTPKIDQSLIDRFETADIPYVLWPISETLQQTRCHVYASDATGLRLVVKVWLQIRRGLNVAADLALIRLFDGVTRLMVNPIPGIPTYVRAALSPNGPFVVYRHEQGTTLDIERTLEVGWVFRTAERLIACVDSLHALDCEHGDIAEKNILVRDEDGEIRLLDLFDLTHVGDGNVRTPSVCPQGWERLTQKQIDRFSTLTILRRLVARLGDTRLDGLSTVLVSELERPCIETFEPVILALNETAALLSGPAAPAFALSLPGGASFESDGGRYYVRVSRVGDDRTRYSLAGTMHELNIEALAGKPIAQWFSQLSYSSLMHATEHGQPIQANIVVSDGALAGFGALLDFLKSLVPEPLAKALPSEVSDVDASGDVDVQRYWQKLLSLEEALKPEVKILGEIGARGPISLYAYERAAGDFDFDSDSTVEVRTPSGRKIGEVDLEQTDERTLVVRYAERSLNPGDRVNLVDRLEKVSLDRRRKAVERIVGDGAQVRQLLSYFSSDLQIEGVDFETTVEETDLELYALNAGQKAAFRHLARFGPVGLLQGPPGTGKTRFIAAFTHWLVTKAGARKILIASQSHEAVNNAIEALIDLFKKFGGRPSLLRIGSKGITDKIQPYHTSSLRERYQARFEGSFKHRVIGMASAMGLPRALADETLEIDRVLGHILQRIATLTSSRSSGDELSAEEQRRHEAAVQRAKNEFVAAGRHLLGRDLDSNQPALELSVAYAQLAEKHPGTSDSDLSAVRNLISLSHEWSDSLASSHRNFEEFLAKTRTIVTATCVGVGQTKIRIDAKAYDWVIVDEAARCTSSELAVPIQVGRRVLLVGDHFQLMPMIDRRVVQELQNDMPDVSTAKLTRSDFARAYTSSYGRKNGQILTEQYRMAPDICDLVSRIFYEPHQVRLETSSNREADPVFCQPLPKFLSAPLVWVDTSADQRHSDQRVDWDEHTRWNPAEVEAVLRILERLSEQEIIVTGLAAGKEETPIGVICMYSAQKVKIEHAFAVRSWEPRFRRLVRIDTVDSYQGKENAIVIVSLVRCNRSEEAGQIRRDTGHVRSPNRCNVALSRAKERLFIVGARVMWQHVAPREPMRQVLEYFDANPHVSLSMASGDI